MSPLTEPTRLTLAKSFTWNETVWNPSMIQTALWLDAADASTLFTTDSGSTLATNGSAVGRWNDKSGNGRNVLQSNAVNRPVFLTNVINGRSVVDSGASGFLISTATHNIGTTSVMAAVVRPNIVSGVNRDYITGGVAGDNSDTHILYQRVTSFPVGLNLYSGTALGGGNVLAVNTPSIMVGITNGDSSSIRHNGTVLSTGAAGAQVWNAGFIIGRSAASTTSYVDAKYGEVVIIPGIGTISSIQRLEGYLAHKWGLTANLPAGHPYKTVGPTP